METDSTNELKVPTERVKIPKALIERLKGLGPHFCLVKAGNKDPSVGGKGWQKPENLMYADDPRLQQHLKRGGNYGVVGGFGLVIVDVDLDELKQLVRDHLPRTFTVQSPGSKGWHLYFLCSLEKPLRLRDKDGENVGDIQGQGKMVVGPGCIHPNGDVYKIVDDRPLAQVTREQLLEAFKEYVIPDREIQRVEAAAHQERRDLKVDLDILQVVSLAGLHKRGNEYYGPHPVHGSTGGQNFWVNSSENVWHCFRHGSGGGPLLWLAVEEGIIDCSEAVPGALRGDKFKQALQKAAERGLIEGRKPTTGSAREHNAKHEEETGRESQASALVKLVLAESITLFHDERREPYIRIRREGALVNMRLRGKDTRTWLSGLLWKDREKAPSSEALSSALNVLEAVANEGEEHQLYNRVAPGEDESVWLDLCDEEWRAIHVTRAGWEVVKHPPILFRRFSHQKPIPTPVHGGSLVPVLDYANIRHLGDQLLYVVTAITYLIPGIPHVLMIFFGPQGSGKTWALRTVRVLIDPSQLGLLSLPTRYREIVQILDHNWCAFFDNVGRLPAWTSNVFCRAVTGAGVSKRRLYSDDEDVIYQYHRCLGLTDINIAAERGDLLQRSLLLCLDGIPEKDRKTEKELSTALKSQHAEILGALLDVLVEAMKLYPTVRSGSLYRMADYTIWGRAITRALGLDPQHFIAAYRENIDAQNLEAVRASPISDALIELMKLHPLGWSGTISQLYSELEEQAKALKIGTRQKAWPKKPNVLSRRINELAPSLSSIGLEITRGYQEKTRLIHINIVGIVGIDGAVERQADWGKGQDLKNYLDGTTDDTDDTDGISASLSGHQTTPSSGVATDNEEVFEKEDLQSGPESAIKVEDLPKSLRIPPGLEGYMKTVKEGKEWLVQCQLCAKAGKQFFTANTSDMMLHIQGSHGKLRGFQPKNQPEGGT